MKRGDRHLLSGLSFGVFLVIVGAIFLITPNLIDEIEPFFRDFELEQVSENIYFPTPQHPHPTLYNSVAVFCFAFGTYQILLLILKFALETEPTQKAETLTSIIFWLTAGSIVLMLKNGSIKWLTFIAGLVILAAIVIIIRSAAHIIFKRRVP